MLTSIKIDTRNFNASLTVMCPRPLYDGMTFRPDGETRNNYEMRVQ